MEHYPNFKRLVDRNMMTDNFGLGKCRSLKKKGKNQKSSLKQYHSNIYTRLLIFRNWMS